MIEEQVQDHQKTTQQVHIPPPESLLPTQSDRNLDLENSLMQLDVGFCLLAIGLKLLPIVWYPLNSLSFFTATHIRILGFTLVLATAAIDFWTIKNITGRKLVSMMWWMKVDLETGDEEWMFVSSQGYSPHVINEAVFWGCCMAGNIFWAVTILLCLILSSLFWISLCAVCLLLSLINFAFFMRCRGNHRQKFKELADRVGLGSAHSLMDFAE